MEITHAAKIEADPGQPCQTCGICPCREAFGYHRMVPGICPPPAVPDTGDVDALTEGELHGLRSIFAGWSTMPNGLREVVEVIVADRVADVRRDTAEQIAQAIEAERPGSERDEEPGNWKRGARYARRRAARIAREAGAR